MKKSRSGATPAEDRVEGAEDSEADAQVIRGEFRSQSSSGPFPSPAVLREFDQIVTGGAERIFRQFEVEASHRRVLEANRARSDAHDKKISQYVAIGFAVGLLLISAYALFLGAHFAASAIGGGAVLMVIASFLGTKFLDKADQE